MLKWMWVVGMVLLIAGQVHAQISPPPPIFLDIFYSDNSNNEDGFGIERDSHDGKGWVEIARVGMGVTTYRDAGLISGQAVSYRVYAWNSVGKSPYSNSADGIAYNHTPGMVVISCGQTILSAPQPILKYPMDEGTGTVVGDVSGKGFTGSLVGLGAGGVQWGIGKYGKGLVFAGGTATAKLVSGLAVNSSLRSYTFWINLSPATSSGGGMFGRIFDKREGGVEVEVVYIDETVGILKYLREWSDATGAWGIAIPSRGVWHHIAIIYDSTSPLNLPVFYLDGLLQPTQTTLQPGGVPLTNTDKYILGNRGAGDRSLAGSVDDFRVYNGGLTKGDIGGIMAGE